MIDVSGPHARRHANRSHDPHAEGQGVPVRDLLRRKVKQGPVRHPTPTPDRSLPPTTPRRDPDRPIVVYVRRRDTLAKACVLQVVPALAALNDNENCRLEGEGHEAFALRGHGGVNSLHFRRPITQRGSHSLAIHCRPLVTDTEPLKSSTIRLNIVII